MAGVPKKYIITRDLEIICQTKIMSNVNIQRIVIARALLDNKIKNSENMEDFKLYISQETLVLNEIRSSKKKMSQKMRNSLESLVIQRITKLYETALQRVPANYDLHEDFFKFLKKNDFTRKATQVVENMTKVFSSKPEIWTFAVDWYCHLKYNDKALQILQKGLTIHPDCTILYSLVIKLEVKQIANLKSAKPAEKLFLENKCCEKLKTYLNTMLRNIRNLEYIISILTILEPYTFTNPVQKVIMDYLVKNHSTEDIVWHSLAKREKKGMHFVSDPNEERRTDSFTKSCILYCIDKYEQGLLSITAEHKKKKLWSNYLETLIEMQSNTVQVPTIDKDALLEEAFQKAHQEGYVEDCYYNVWLEKMPIEEARETLKEATRIHPHSQELWKMQLSYAVRSDNANDVDHIFKLGVEALKEQSLPLWLMLLRFHLLASDNKTMRDIYEKGICQSPEISDVIKPKYIEWIAFQEDMNAARARYSALALLKPHCRELHLVMSKLESTELTPDHESCRKVHELACEQFGEGEVEVWLNYLKFIIFIKPDDLQEQVKRIYDESKQKLSPLLWQQFQEVYLKLLT